MAEQSPCGGDLRPLALVPPDLRPDQAEMEWRDGDFEADGEAPGRTLRRTEDRSPITLLRRLLPIRDALGAMWQMVDGIDPEDVCDLYEQLDDAIADFRGDPLPKQLRLGVDTEAE